jgi:hypothetical protein
MSTPQNQQEEPVPTPSEEEYKHLISHFERLIRLTTIIVALIVGAGSFFFYKSVGDMKDDERKVVESVKASAQNDVTKAKGEVLDAVRAEASKRVNEEFETNHITEMVEAAAKRKVGRAIDRQIQEEVAQTVTRLQDQIVETSEIANLGMQVRVIGSRGAFNELTSRYKKSDDPGIRRTEKIVLDSLTADFENVWIHNLGRDQRNAQQQLSMGLPTGPIQPIPTTTANFVRIIRTEQDLNGVCLGFLALRDSTGVHFPMFDMDAVEKWCKENSSKCQQ